MPVCGYEVKLRKIREVCVVPGVEGRLRIWGFFARELQAFRDRVGPNLQLRFEKGFRV